MSLRTAAPGPALVETDELPDYPFAHGDRLDSHFFMVWQRRRWLNSEMHLRGGWACQGVFFALINHAFDQSPIGTLPVDMGVLAKLVRCERGEFEAMCAQPYGPLHGWAPCNCDGEVRLMHRVVLDTLTDGFARREDNRARTEAANSAKRLQRLRIQLTGMEKSLGENDHAVRWIDEWLVDQGCTKRTASWVERGVRAWVQHRKGMSEVGGRR
ncbi:hypothetical protein [uncultured Jannaschia sp.]|uniref:hypothetical protein n=1 Tax=uncultured Jannaschia sp. TaxID=293347 RepID=UPI00261F1596|nr:hypothetical protein [uncultured Jannaschia sp.]